MSYYSSWGHKRVGHNLVTKHNGMNSRWGIIAAVW